MTVEGKYDAGLVPSNIGKPNISCEMKFTVNLLSLLSSQTLNLKLELMFNHLPWDEDA